MDSPKHPISLARFLPSATRRHLVKTLLFVLRDYSHCSIASQLCIQILGQVMTMFDVVDVCELQRFVINEFKKRHRRNRDLDESVRQQSVDEGTEYKPVSRHKIDHTNMQSAQVNQMTQQLKERVELVRKYYNLKSREEIKEKTGIDVMYEDLIDADDRKYWADLCKKDFRRLEKYQVLNIGEGHFLEESSEEVEEEPAKPTKEERDAAVPLEGLLFHKGDRSISEVSGDKGSEVDFDHNKFMEEMMKNIQEQQNNDEAEQKTQQMQDQIQKMEEHQQRKKDQEEAQFSDNNFWRIQQPDEAQHDVDALLKELEDNERDDAKGQASGDTSKNEPDTAAEPSSSPQDATSQGETQAADDNKQKGDEPSGDQSQAKGD